MASTISTDIVPVQKRFRFFNDIMQRLFDAYWDEGAPFDSNGFNAIVTSHKIGNLCVCEVSASPFWLEKASKADCENIFVSVVDKGETLLHIGEEQYKFGKGDAYIACINAITRVETRIDPEHQNNKTTSIAIPRKMVEQVFGCYDFSRPILIPTKGGVNAAFLEMFGLFCRHAAGMEAETDSHTVAAEHLENSLLNSLGAVLYSVPNPQIVDCSNKNTQINRIRNYVKANLHEDLSLAKIAKAVNLSRRYVHSLFENEPVTLMKWVMHERLDRCRRELGGCSPNRSIKEIAYSWGFKGQVQFSHAFRKRFGMSPTEYRLWHTSPPQGMVESNVALSSDSQSSNEMAVAAPANDKEGIFDKLNQLREKAEAGRINDKALKIGIAIEGAVLIAEAFFAEFVDFFQMLPV